MSVRRIAAARACAFLSLEPTFDVPATKSRGQRSRRPRHIVVVSGGNIDLSWFATLVGACDNPDRARFA